MTPVRPVRAVVLLSGNGSTLQNFLDRATAGTCPIAVVGVVASRPDAFGLERAWKAGIPGSVVIVDPRHPERAADALTEAVDRYSPELVLLCGFNHLWLFPERFTGRVMNVHLPGLFKNIIIHWQGWH